MGIQINGTNDTISATDNSLSVVSSETTFSGISTFSDLTISSAGTTKSGWFSTLDSKSDFDNVSLFSQPDSVFDFSSSKSAAENYYPALFTSALTSANTTYLSQLIGGRFNTNVAGTNSSSPVRAYGAIFSARRNSTTDVSSSTSNQLFGSQSFVIQGGNVSDSVNTEIAFGEASSIYHNKGNITKAYSHAAELSIAGGSNEQVNTNITDAELVGYRHASTIGNSGSGISTISQYNFFESNATVFSSARISDVCGVKLGFTAPFVGTVERYKAIDIGTTAGPALQYSIYSPSDSVTMYHQGNIGIGTTNPIMRLHVHGDANDASSRIRLSSVEGSGLTIRAQSATENNINVDSGEFLSFTVGNTEGFRMNSSGNIAFVSGNGIDFSANTAAGTGTTTSSILDDYEEGTWTPEFATAAGSTANISAQPATRIGSYTKIGNRVLFNLWINGNLTTTETTNSIIIQGLPYNAISGNTGYGALVSWNFTGFNTYKDEIILRSQPAADEIILQRNGTNLTFDDIVKSGINFMVSGQYISA